MVTHEEENACHVFYDGSCPLCRKEIDFYRRREGAERVEWIDVSAEDYPGTGGAPARDEAMKRFHVRRADGGLVSGGAAFAELWAALPELRILGIIFRIPPFSWAIKISYRAFLPMRPALQRIATQRR
jgi:predicted DCC family thiol-disulfide oxidoreductase YuxK